VSSGLSIDTVLRADQTWHTIDFISDLHLQTNEPATFAAWQHYMAGTPADAVFILGDLFEVWVGDDALLAKAQGENKPFEADCQQVLQTAAERLSVYFMHGNRDFLFGDAAAKACGLTLLRDPTVLVFEEHRWLLSHGDVLCVADTDYQQFRESVRSDVWRTAFLAKPLSERQSLARAIRTQSEAKKASAATFFDVDGDTAATWLRAAQANTLIHGHTHRAAEHILAENPDLRRVVLSDWDAQADPPRLQILRMQVGQPLQRLTLDDAIKA
jgi:UDP-2,3-diacylglucosamine hydrolase